MKIRLNLTVEYDKKRKGLSCLVETGINIRQDLSSALSSVFPYCRLPASGSLSFTTDNERITLISSVPLTVNGVSVRSRRLKSRDRIIFGEVRIFYNSFVLIGAESATAKKTAAAGLFPEIYIKIKIFAAYCADRFRRIRGPDSGLKAHPFRTAGIFVTITAACIIAGCLSLPDHNGSSAHEQDPSELTTSRSGTLPRTERQDRISSESAYQPQIPEDQSDDTRNKILVIPPGGIVPDFDLDILFIHAHPDDESLDFGCLMARCEAAGLKTGLVTLTDGESGRDLYPNRPVTGIYPDHYMEGTELAAVRARELEKAARTLGVDLLIRLGLKNHPYNKIKDELPPDDIIKIWGGKEELTGVLRQIILRTRPETVVAPEGPGKAREHFEHEATGLITAETLAGFKPDDYRAPKRFLTCIDPRQHHLYPEASLIDAGQMVTPDSGMSRTLRGIQLEALLNHRTQNDAVNVGTGFLPKYPAEYYSIQYWRSNRSWEELLESGLYQVR